MNTSISHVTIEAICVPGAALGSAIDAGISISMRLGRSIRLRFTHAMNSNKGHTVVEIGTKDTPDIVKWRIRSIVGMGNGGILPYEGVLNPIGRVEVAFSVQAA